MGIFFRSYIESDFFGKLIFLFLFILSVTCWTVLIRKFRTLKSAHALGREMRDQIRETQLQHLLFQSDPSLKKSPFSRILSAIASKTTQIINKNHHFNDQNNPFLSKRDIEMIDEYCSMTIYQEIKILSKDLFILSTIVSLAPFVGILGTVWGILLCLGELQKGGVGSHSIILAGLSTALATTVLGLVIAIPALIAYNYFKNALTHITTDMEEFSQIVLSEIELQYTAAEV